MHFDPREQAALREVGLDADDLQTAADLVADAVDEAAADLAAVPELGVRLPDWAASSVPARVELLAALRLWLPACPDCGGTVSLSRDTVSSCCRSVPVAAGTCDDCGVRLFEVPVDETAADAE